MGRGKEGVDGIALTCDDALLGGYVDGWSKVVSPTAAERRAGEAEIVGALCLGLLRSFEAGARGAGLAPSIDLAERQASFAAEEFDRFLILRERLNELTEDPSQALEALAGPLTSFYEGARPDDWLQAQVFQFVGDTLTTDFADILASRLDERTASAVRRALTGRTAQETFALEQIRRSLDTDPDSRERVAKFTGAMIGAAMGRLRDALLASDALELVLGEGGVKECVLELLGRHRERLERLGVDPVD